MRLLQLRLILPVSKTRCNDERGQRRDSSASVVVEGFSQLLHRTIRAEYINKLSNQSDRLLEMGRVRQICKRS
jgi:hypothetical protein